MNQLVVFMQEETAAASSSPIRSPSGTISFWEHISDFITAQECERCHQPRPPYCRSQSRNRQLPAVVAPVQRKGALI